MKYALVTGGSRGIGKAICLKLAKDGYFVIINYRANDTEAINTLRQIEANGGKGELLKFDVGNFSEVNEILGKWIEKNSDKHIEILVNNAGIIKDNLMVFMPVEDWNSVISTNLGSFFNVTKLLLQNMLLKKCGKIINIVSLSGQKGQAGQVNYAASKGAIIAATKSLAMEVGKKNVIVNAVAPGFIKTYMTEHLDEKELAKLIPLRRFGTVDEVAEVVSFLASDKASYITGEVISVNGGIYS